MFGVLYGPPGIGKTSFCASMPNCEFVIDSGEQGVITLERFGQIEAVNEVREIASWDELLETESLIADDTETVVFDSATGLERLCFRHVCDAEWNGDWSKDGFYAYYAGPRTAARRYWPEFLDMCERIRQSGKHVWLIAHANVGIAPNPEGANYDQYQPYLDKETWAQTHRQAQCVLFANYHIEVETKGLKQKGKGGDRRYIYTEWSPAYVAKNWFGLEPLIDMGTSGKEAFDNFKEALIEARK